MTDLHHDAPAATAAPTAYRVTAHSSPSSRASAEAAGAVIPFDGTWGRPYAGLPGPAELLASSFAACLLKNLARARVLMGYEYTEADVEIVAERQDSPPRFVSVHYTLRVRTAESARRTELMHRNLTKFGTVYNTLAAVCDVHGEVVRVAPQAASAANPS
jgi:uncharacterized OsmC-like protein